jgi:hypothetical protein
MFIVNCPPIMSELNASLTAPEPAVVPFSAGCQKEGSRRDTDDLLSSIFDHTLVRLFRLPRVSLKRIQAAMVENLRPARPLRPSGVFLFARRTDQHAITSIKTSCPLAEHRRPPRRK